MQYDFSESFRTIRCNILYSLLVPYHTPYIIPYVQRITFSAHIYHRIWIFCSHIHQKPNYDTIYLILHTTLYESEIYTFVWTWTNVFNFLFSHCMANICKTCKRDCTKLWVIVFSTSSYHILYIHSTHLLHWWCKHCNNLLKLNFSRAHTKWTKKHWTEATLMFIVRFSPV